MKRLALALALLLVPELAAAYTYVSGQFTTNTSNGSQQMTGTSTLVYAYVLKAACTNTVDVHIGPSTVNASSAKGRTLSPCESRSLSIEQGQPFLNLNEIYLDSGTSAAVVEYEAVAP